MPLEFTDPDVSAKYVCSEDDDRKVTKQGDYSGKLSGINLKMADGMFKRGSNLLKLKTAAPATNTSKPVVTSTSASENK